MHMSQAARNVPSGEVRFDVASKATTTYTLRHRIW
jgi:hypothetical protein